MFTYLYQRFETYIAMEPFTRFECFDAKNILSSIYVREPNLRQPNSRRHILRLGLVSNIK